MLFGKKILEDMKTFWMMDMMVVAILSTVL